MHLPFVPLSLLTLSCLLLPTFARPVSADPIPPTNLRPDILYTHRGEFVQVKPMRPLTLNAHVTEFAYDPLGIEIAYSGSSVEGDKTTYFVKTVDTRTGHELSQLAYTAPAEDRNTALSLIGWSVSGKYLLLRKFSPDPNQPDTAIIEFLRWDLSASPPTTRVIQPQSALPPEQQSADLTGSANGYLSPDGRWLAFSQSVHTMKMNGKPGPDQNVYLLYDPERDTFKPLPLPPNAGIRPWVDNTHLKFWQGDQRKQLDVTTGQTSPQPETTKLDPLAASKQYPDLSLSYEQQDLEDKQVKGSGGHIPTCVVWIHRAPFGKTPFGAAAAALMPYGNISSPDIANPQAVWSPTGKQIAFVANDDLSITDLVVAAGPMPSEKLAVGLKLSCEEECILAMSDLKQIGLGLIQFIQDNDEKYPASTDFMKSVYPYIKTMDVFSVDGHPFVYKQPVDLSLAAMESPADTENGYMDLPCARVVLYADGHVKSLAK